MTLMELEKLIVGGEGSTVEFKRDTLRPEQLAREIAAMANLQGGTILLGVEDDGSISGITRPRLNEWIFDTVISRYIHPVIIPCYEEIPLDDNRRVAVLSFTQGVSKPYIVKYKDREELYIRLGSVTRLATREQQIRLYASGGLLQPEILPVSGTSYNTLDKVRLDNYLRDILQDPEVPESESEWIDRLLGLGLMTRNALGDPVCTIAGLVLFGIRPRLFLRQAGIRLMAFNSTDKEYQARLDTVLDAPLVGRWQISENQRTLIDAGLIEKFTETLRPFIAVEAAEIDRYFRREKTWLYPSEAVRESVINALAHRDWTRFVDVEVCLYADRMEIISPGALQDAMSIEKMKAGLRSMRNQIVMEVLRDYGYVDARGMGIRTKVIPLMKATGKEPRFVATEDFMKTILEVSGPSVLLPEPPNFSTGPVFNDYIAEKNTPVYKVKRPVKTPAKPLKRKLDDLLIAIQTSPGATYEELAEAIGTSPATVKRRIQQLKKTERIRREGSKKTGGWEVLRG